MTGKRLVIPKKKLIRLKDGLHQNEKSSLSGLRGEVIFGKGLIKIPFIDPYGKMSYRTEFKKVDAVLPNIVPIGGYQFAFSKLFNIGLDQ